MPVVPTRSVVRSSVADARRSAQRVWDVAGFARFQHKNENGYRVILKRPG